MAAIPFLLVIAATNKYVFEPTNHIYLLMLMFLALSVWGSVKVPSRLFTLDILIPLMLFTIYMVLRLNVEPIREVMRDDLRVGVPDVIDQFIYYSLFISSAVLYYRRSRLSLFLWYLVAGYILMFIIRNTLEFSDLKTGYNLSPGFVLFTLVPFVFLRIQNAEQSRFVPNTILLGCLVWLALLGARTAMMVLIIFYACMVAWPFITRTRQRYFALFWGSLLFIFILNIVYLIFVAEAKSGFIEELSELIFNKSVGTRALIWFQIVSMISKNPWFGYGTASSGAYFSNIITTLHRPDLATHSLYLEILLRLGIVGLVLFIFILFGIWKTFWIGRNEWAVRISASFLIATVFFGTTTEFLIFHWPIRSGLGWVILGVGLGATLKAIKAQSRHITGHGSRSFLRGADIGK